MNLQDFLTSNNLASQAALARALGVSPQSLKQYLERDSSTFKLLVERNFPAWQVRYTEGEYEFLTQEQPLGGSILHTRSKKTLLIENDSLNSNPAVYSFIAALDCDPIDLALDYDRQCLYVGRPGSSEAFAWFPFDQVPDLVAVLEAANEEIESPQ